VRDVLVRHEMGAGSGSARRLTVAARVGTDMASPPSGTPAAGHERRVREDV
jgi:hypothetical protein